MSGPPPTPTGNTVGPTKAQGGGINFRSPGFLACALGAVALGGTIMYIKASHTNIDTEQKKIRESVSELKNKQNSNLDRIIEGQTRNDEFNEELIKTKKSIAGVIERIEAIDDGVTQFSVENRAAHATLRRHTNFTSKSAYPAYSSAFSDRGRRGEDDYTSSPIKPRKKKENDNSNRRRINYEDEHSDRYASPSHSADRYASPGQSADRYASPSQSADRYASPSQSADRYASPKANERFLISPKNHEQEPSPRNRYETSPVQAKKNKRSPFVRDEGGRNGRDSHDENDGYRMGIRSRDKLRRSEDNVERDTEYMGRERGGDVERRSKKERSYDDERRGDRMVEDRERHDRRNGGGRKERYPEHSPRKSRYEDRYSDGGGYAKPAPSRGARAAEQFGNF
jgi:hypothetical protein